MSIIREWGLDQARWVDFPISCRNQKHTPEALANKYYSEQQKQVNFKEGGGEE